MLTQLMMKGDNYGLSN